MASETNLDPRDRLAVMVSMAGSYIESGRGDDALAVMRTVAEDVAAEIARLTRELEEARERERALPRTADGVPIVPGMELWCEYLGDRWEARVVAVHAAAIDIQYTNASSHAAQYAVARLRHPGDWYAATPPAEGGGDAD